MPNLKAAFSKLVGGLLCLPAMPVFADWAVNMPIGVTPISREVYSLHMIIFWICVVIGVGVFAVMFWSIYHHRKSRGVKAATFHESHIVEIIWTIIPFFILVGMSVPAAKTLIMMEDTSGSELTIKVTGYQWMWQYEYLDNGISFYSKLDEASNRARQLNAETSPYDVPNYLLNVDNPLVVPINKKIRILLTANDVIHAWWVPDLGGKKDAIPGFINELWVKVEEPGVYRGQCAELCGKDHGYMPIVVEAVSEADYEQWVSAQQSSDGNPVALNLAL